MSGFARNPGRRLAAPHPAWKMCSMNATLWKLARSKWRKPVVTTRTPGYSVLLPVPGDLPVFLRIAMGTINAQRNDGLVETLVIPDLNTPAFEAAFESGRREWSN